MKILVLGANGMFGSAVYDLLANSSDHEVLGTVRDTAKAAAIAPTSNGKISSNIDVLDEDALVRTMLEFDPELVINCTGLIKQRPEANDPLQIFPINGMFPHKIANLCKLSGARLIQFSTDCIFSGVKGNYGDNDECDVSEYYGLSKYIGEIRNSDHVLTLRTSIIGHEKDSKLQLVNWFLSQQNSVKGYTKAIFSGFPTIVIAQILRDHVVPNSKLSGMYNLSADPIAKYDLLNIIAKVYNKKIEIVADDVVKIDRSLDSSNFRKITGYKPPNWTELVTTMRNANTC